MEQKCLDGFRPPHPKDLMDNVSLCSYPWSNHISVRLWGCLKPQTDNGEDENFSVENVAKKLRYGCRVASRSVRKKEIVVSNCNLGLTEYVVVETIHGKKFMVLPFKFIWAILPL